MVTAEFIATFGRVMIAATMVVAGLSKLRGRAAYAAYAASLQGRRWRSETRQKGAAAALPPAELASALLLAVPATVSWGYDAALVLLLGITATAIMAVRSGRHVRCRCFGRAEESIGVSTLIRNAVLMSAGAAGLAGALVSAGRPGSPAVQVLAVGSGLLGAAVIVYWADLTYLLSGRPVRGTAT